MLVVLQPPLTLDIFQTKKSQTFVFHGLYYETCLVSETMTKRPEALDETDFGKDRYSLSNRSRNVIEDCVNGITDPDEEEFMRRLFATIQSMYPRPA